MKTDVDVNEKTSNIIFKILFKNEDGTSSQQLGSRLRISF